jgi:hypothetical protein
MITGFNQIAGKMGDSGVDLFFKLCQVMAGTIQQIDTQRYGSHIKVLIFKHFKGGQDFSLGKHFCSYSFIRGQKTDVRNQLVSGVPPQADSGVTHLVHRFNVQRFIGSLIGERRRMIEGIRLQP